MTDGYVVNNHGDRFRPPTGATWDPFHSWPLKMACKWGAHPITTYPSPRAPSSKWRFSQESWLVNQPPPGHVPPLEIKV